MSDQPPTGLQMFNFHFGGPRKDIGEEQEEAEGKLEHELHRGSGNTVVFVEHAARIYFGFDLQYLGRKLMLYGEVPAKEGELGIEGMRAYAEGKFEEAMRVFRASIDEDEAFRANPDVVIEVVHEGVVVRGRIVHADGRYFTLRVEEPFQAEERGGGYNRASAMAGLSMFSSKDGKTCLSKDAIKSAERQLLELYKKRLYVQQHAASISLVKRLNREG